MENTCGDKQRSTNLVLLEGVVPSRLTRAHTLIESRNKEPSLHGDQAQYIMYINII